ncbi:integrating conjugative element protein [Rahnella sp. BCC 1045]|uniref:integrating conjugative element protein n=1 Tax=Rahnella sp. BCC 1045 TaxID=2816251 RepID=UPI001C268038|nr:integrating conjugative element protein [Rahnella sp. BCC 1045]MBU9819882.1 integrating conjugative element protein [Rahnella sp. BCC 1045]
MKILKMMVLMCAVGCSTAGYAALTVVGDLGGAPTDTYFDAVNDQPGEFPPQGTAEQPQAPAQVSVASALPVRTPELSPGAVTPRKLTLPGMPPVFIIGDDDLSRRWLAQRGAELSRLNATGFVVNVADQSRLKALQVLLPGSDMVPVSGSDLARRLQLTHYPLIITDKGLAQ